jgi:hypothetical protein
MSTLEMDQIYTTESYRICKLFRLCKKYLSSFRILCMDTPGKSITVELVFLLSSHSLKSNCHSAARSDGKIFYLLTLTLRSFSIIPDVNPLQCNHMKVHYLFNLLISLLVSDCFANPPNHQTRKNLRICLKFSVTHLKRSPSPRLDKLIFCETWLHMVSPLYLSLISSFLGLNGVLEAAEEDPKKTLE